MKKLLLLTLILTGCAGARLQTATYSPKKGGVLVAKNGSLTASKSRDKALQIGNEFCGNDINILEESVEDRVVAMQTSFSGDSATTTPKSAGVRYIKFECP